jgi:hypothetical protein
VRNKTEQELELEEIMEAINSIKDERIRKINIYSE